MSWYRESSHAGQFLVISSSDLIDYGLSAEVVIRDSKFWPEKLPDDDAKQQLISQSNYQKTKPDEWDDLENEDPVLISKWLKVMGIRNMTYEELFVSHCANHANFIEPMFYIEEDEFGKVSYSIAKKSNLVCSACLSFIISLVQCLRRSWLFPALEELSLRDCL